MNLLDILKSRIIKANQRILQDCQIREIVIKKEGRSIILSIEAEGLFVLRMKDCKLEIEYCPLQIDYESVDYIIETDRDEINWLLSLKSIGIFEKMRIANDYARGKIILNEPLTDEDIKLLEKILKKV